MALLDKIGGWLRPNRKPAASGSRPAFDTRAPWSSERDVPVSRLPRFSRAASEANDTHALPGLRADRGRLSTAFTPSQPISDLRGFVGREQIFSKLIRAIEDQRMHLVIYGERGIGKTSILHVLSALAREARYLVRYNSCSEQSGFDETFRAIARDIPLLYHRDYDPASPEAEGGGTLADTFDARPLSPSYVADAFDRLVGTRLLIILDEYDRSQAEGFRESVAELIKNLSDRASKVQIIIGGVAGNLTELVEHIPSIRRNVIGIPLTRMSKEEVRQIVVNGEQRSGLRFDEAAQTLVVNASQGSPYIANLLGHYAGSRALDRLGKTVTGEDGADGIADVVEELRARLSVAGLHQLEMLQRLIPPPVIQSMAHHALANSGSIDAGDAATVSAMVTRAADRAATFDGSGAFRFVDDSLPLVLWLGMMAPEDGTVGISPQG